MQISILETFTRHQPETLSLCRRWWWTQIKFSGAVGLRGTEISFMQLYKARIKSLWLAWYPSQHQDLASPKCLQAAVLNTSYKSTSKMGTQSQPSANMLLQVVLSSQTAQNTPPDVALLSEGKDSALPPGAEAAVPHTRKRTLAPEPASPTTGADSRRKRSHTAQLGASDSVVTTNTG